MRIWMLHITVLLHVVDHHRVRDVASVERRYKLFLLEFVYHDVHLATRFSRRLPKVELNDHSMSNEE